MTAAINRVWNASGWCRRRSALTVALLATVSVTTSASASSASAGSGIPASQALVVLRQDHLVRTGPSAAAGRMDGVAARRPLTGVRTVLPVLAQATSRTGGEWLRVRLPGRPNGHQGWISRNRTRLTVTEWRIVVSRSARRVSVYHAGELRRRFRAVVGKPSTPTPRGAFFIEEVLALSAGEAGGPYALATSARSNVFQEFEGGPGQIGIHGTNNLSGTLGTAVSHGCVRLDSHAITWLARRIGAGVPLTIAR